MAPSRLLELANTFQIDRSYPGLHLCILPTVAPTKDDVNSVQSDLKRRRSVRAKSAAGMFRPRSSTMICTTEEATEVLQDLVQSECSPGQAAYLIELGANINYKNQPKGGLIKRIRGKEPEGVRSFSFQSAIESGNHALVRALALAADRFNRNETLKIAISRLDLEMVKILMAADADPNQCQSQFQELVQNGSTELVRILVSGRVHRLSAELASANLYEAVATCRVEMVRMLLYCGANADVQDPSPLLRATHSQNLSIVAAMCLAENPPSPAHLASAIAAACGELPSVSASFISIVEILLAAGACGEGLSRALIQVTKAGNSQAVELLVRHSKFDTGCLVEAIRCAITGGDLAILQSLVSPAPSPEIIDDIFVFITATWPEISANTRLKMATTLLRFHPSPTALGQLLLDASKHSELDLLSLLIDAGAHQTDVTAALSLSFEKCIESELNHNLIDLLVRGGADVNTQGGACISSAVTKPDIHALKLLLKGSPSSSSLSHALSTTASTKLDATRYDISKILVHAGASGIAIDRLLFEVINDSELSGKFRQLFLVDGKASIDYKDGDVLVRAIKQENPDMVRELTKFRPSQASLSNGLFQAVRISQSKLRLEMCGMLLQTEPKPTAQSLSQCLIEVVRLYPGEDLLTRTLLAWGASVDYDTGKALHLALQRQDEKLFKQLLAQAVSSETLLRLLADILRFNDESQKLLFVQMILATSININKDRMGDLLHKTFSASDQLVLLRTMLQYGATVNLNPPKAILKAIKISNERALKLLLKADVDGTILQQAFDCAWESTRNGLSLLRLIAGSTAIQLPNMDQYLVKAVDKTPTERELVEFLLDVGARVEHASYQCIITAAKHYNEDILKLLMEQVKSPDVLSNTFQMMMGDEGLWQEKNGIAIVMLFLEHGVHRNVLDHNLLLAAQRYHTHKNASSILHALMSYGASVGPHNEYTVKFATQAGDRAIVKQLLRNHVAVGTLQNVFPYVFLSGANEPTVLGIIEDFVSHTNGSLDLNAALTGLNPVLFLAMEHFPRSVDITRSLLHHGAWIEQTVNVTLDAKCGPELVTPLLFALSGSQVPASDAIVHVLVSNGAQINFTSAQSRTTPLLCAVKQSRSAVIEMLLSKSANPAAANQYQCTPLYYASTRGDLHAMNLLIKSQAPVDDGSLHEAILQGHTRAVAALLEAGHDANIPSIAHENKTPLVILVQENIHFDQPSARIEMFRRLVKHGANKRYQLRGKSLLFLALDSPFAATVTPALLGAFMGNDINEDYNLYRCDNHIYSPLSYLINNQQKSPASLKDGLLTAMAPYGCAEVYYSVTGPQPPDFRGAPPDIMQRERERAHRLERLAESEEDHQRALRRRQEIELEDLKQMQRSHELTLARESEQAHARLQQQRDANLQAERFEEHRRNAELERVRAEHRLQLEYKTQSALQDQAVMDAQRQSKVLMLEMETRQQRELQNIYAEGHRRAMLEIEAKRAGTVEQQRLINSQSKLAQASAWVRASQPLQITSSASDHESEQEPESPD